MWAPEIACPVCVGCHANETNSARGKEITRGELVRAGVWVRAMAWARERDAEPPSGRVIRRPVVSRLEHEYPAAPMVLPYATALAGGGEAR